MSIIINAKGTSVPYFGIGKNGVTMYQGSADPAGSYTIKNGDYWFNSSNNSLNVRTSGAWAAPALGSLNFPTSSGSSGYILSTNGSGTLSWIPPASGTVSTVSVATANGLAGTVATATSTPVITLSTTVSGLLNGNGTAISAATAGTDYSVGTSALATGILKSTTSTGTLSIAVPADFPTLNQNTTGTASNVTGTIAVTNGGTGLTSLGSSNQLLGVNSAGNAAEYKTITAGTAISVSNAANSITIANTGVTSAVAGTNIAVSGTTGAVTFSVTGTVPSATNATNAAITDDTTTNASVYPTWVTSNTDNLPQKVTSTKLSFNPSTGLLTSTGFSGSGALLTNIPNTALANSSILVSNGTGISVSGSPVSLGGTVTITNSGVTSLTAGTNVSLSGSTGDVTVSVSGSLATSTTITDDTTTNATVYPTWVTAASGNLPTKVSSTKIFFNPSTGLLSSSAFTTPGNLTFTGTGNRISGDFSNATLSNRTAIQTSTTNGSTGLTILPNGTATGAAMNIYNNSNPTNASFAQLQADTTSTKVSSGATGSGTQLPLEIITNGSTRMTVATNGNISLQTTGADLSNIASLNGGQLAGFRNRIINGQMLIDQRYGGVAQTPVADSYILDRWKLQISQASKLTVQTVIDAPVGFYASTLLTVASAFTPAATDFFIYRQYIEANNTTDFKMGTAGAKSIAVSFWVKGSVAGTYSGVIINSGSPRAYPFNYTVTTGWAKQTIIIPGDTSGSWVTGGNGVGMNLLVDLGAGTNYQGTANAWASTTLHGVTGATKFVSQTAGATLNITGVQLEIGTVSTEFEQRMFSTELALCQRYLEIINNDVIGYAAAGTNIGGRTKFAVNKRAVPTVSQIANNISFTQTNVTTTTCTYIANSSEGVIHYRAATASAATQYSENAVARAEY